MSDRIVAVLLMIVTIAFGIQAWSYVPIGFTDILGARAFPMAIALFMVPLLLILFFGRHVAGVWPSRHAWKVVIIALTTLVVYGVIVDTVGFFIATTMVFIIYGLLFNARWWKTAIAGVLASFALYALFVWALDMYLPVGEIFKEVF
jgi:putative tricarboxylic transport membrane protein